MVAALSVVSEKFLKSPGMQRLLLTTVNTILVDAADYDSEWDVLLGLPHICDLGEWRGLNVLGEALMITCHFLLTGNDIWQQKFFFTQLRFSLSESLEDFWFGTG